MRTMLPDRAVIIPSNATQVFNGIIFDVYHWQQSLPDGSTATFEMLKRPDTVKVIAVKDNQIVVITEKQPNQATFYDIPGGRHDHENESELEAAKRELKEETGMSFKSWRLINSRQTHRRIEHFVYIFLAIGFDQQVAQILDTSENISVQLMPFDDAKRVLTSQESRYVVEDIARCDSLDDLLNLPVFPTHPPQAA